MLAILSSILAARDADVDFSEGDVVTLIVGLLLIAVLAAVAYVGGRRVGRPVEASWLAFAVIAVGVILLLLALL